MGECEGSASAVATILPGRGYSPDHPVLYYIRQLLLARGWTVRSVAWGQFPQDQQLWPEHVRRITAPELDIAADRRLMVAKSLGTHALPDAVDRGLPGIWLTPLLHEQRQVEALRQVRAPTLLLGGTGDPYWDPDTAHDLADFHSAHHSTGRSTDPSTSGLEILELPGLDHSLEVPGDPAASVQALARLLTHVDHFLASVHQRGP